jgi:hypothetical protein
MEVIENRGLLLKVRNPNQITAAIPNSKNLGNNNVLVRWGIDGAAGLSLTLTRKPRLRS